MSKCLLRPWMFVWSVGNVSKPKTIIFGSKKNKAMERKIKIVASMVMVIFDFIIMMPTLSINSISFLNQTFLTLCLVSKNTWKWTFWCLPNLQLCLQFVLTSIQSGNVQTETRSPPNWISIKPLSLSKPEPPSDAKECY